MARADEVLAAAHTPGLAFGAEFLPTQAAKESFAHPGTSTPDCLRACRKFDILRIRTRRDRILLMMI